ncbi:hypothetical protein [Puniceibacterium confluentis]|nr:hypothetical protein [Puniceibacterium confluentis]
MIRGSCACGAITFSTPATPTGLRSEKHNFTVGKGDYHALSDGLPQKD